MCWFNAVCLYRWVTHEHRECLSKGVPLWLRGLRCGPWAATSLVGIRFGTFVVYLSLLVCWGSPTTWWLKRLQCRFAKKFSKSVEPHWRDEHDSSKRCSLIWCCEKISKISHSCSTDLRSGGFKGHRIWFTSYLYTHRPIQWTLCAVQ